MTLIEAMTSAAVFMIGVVALLGLHLSIAKTNATANDLSVASNLATAVLEQQQLQTYADVAGVNTTYYDRTGAEGPAESARYFTATATGTVDPLGWYTDVLVEVTWAPSADAQSFTVSLNGRVRDPAR